MHQNLFTLMATGTLAVLSLCATPQAALAAEQVRELPAFESISSRGAYKIVVDVGQQQAVRLKGPEAELGKVTTDVSGGELLLGVRGKSDRVNGFWDDAVEVSISLPQLRRFQMDGAGTTQINRMAGDSLEIVYRGAGTLSVNGSVKSLVLRVEGVGALDTKDLAAQSVNASLDGVGSVKVRASESLTAKVNGLGSLTYYGRPARINKSVGGIGSVSAGD